MTSKHSRFGLRPMLARDAGEPHRVASSLELFFDLIFVVAVGASASNLHHALVEGHAAHGIEMFLITFMSIWWAWMNYNWFATAFDVDDWLYRLLTVGQMGGIIIFAAGVGFAFQSQYTLILAGYIVMRIFMALQWIRAGLTNPDYRATTFTYAAGILLVQVIWAIWYFLFSQSHLGMLVLLAIWGLELLVPLVAERRRTTPWHPHHITERYGLFALVILGEGLLGSSNAIIEGIQENDSLAHLLIISLLALLGSAALWWIYFWAPHHGRIGGFWQSLFYGYGHYFIFASAAAFAAGIEVLIDLELHEAHLSSTQASFALALPVACYLFFIWLLVIRPVGDRLVDVTMLAATVLVFADFLVPFPAIWTVGVLLAVVVVLVVRQKSVAQD